MKKEQPTVTIPYTFLNLRNCLVYTIDFLYVCFEQQIIYKVVLVNCGQISKTYNYSVVLGPIDLCLPGGLEINCKIFDNSNGTYCVDLQL